VEISQVRVGVDRVAEFDYDRPMPPGSAQQGELTALVAPKSWEHIVCTWPSRELAGCVKRLAQRTLPDGPERKWSDSGGMFRQLVELIDRLLDLERGGGNVAGDVGGKIAQTLVDAAARCPGPAEALKVVRDLVPGRSPETAAVGAAGEEEAREESQEEVPFRLPLQTRCKFIQDTAHRLAQRAVYDGESPKAIRVQLDAVLKACAELPIEVSPGSQEAICSSEDLDNLVKRINAGVPTVRTKVMQ